MKKIAILALASVLSVSAYAGDAASRQERAEIARQHIDHGVIPHLEKMEYTTRQGKDDSRVQWRYTGESEAAKNHHAPEQRLGSDK